MYSTFSIYEDLKQTLDEKAAHQIAHHLSTVYEELRQAVTKSDFDELRQVVKELAEAQKRTEREFARFAGEMGEMRREMGGLSHTIGYTLGNEAYKALPPLLKRDFGIDLHGRLRRGYLPDRERAGKTIEVNILGEGIRDGKPVRIIGEAKSQVSVRKADAYLDRIAPRLDTGDAEPFVVLVAHMESAPGVAEHVRGRGAALYFTFEF